MNVSKTLSQAEALKVRWGNVVGPIFGAIRDYDEPKVIFEASQDDYQGWARILADLGAWRGKRFAYYAWTYGSCSGCDSWEDADPKARAEEIIRGIQTFTFDELKAWGEMLRKENSHLFTDPDPYDDQNTRGLVAAIEALKEEP